MTETQPNRRWFQVSLRTLFVLVTIVGACAGWVAYQPILFIVLFDRSAGFSTGGRRFLGR
jgi:hypothetical protein